jgi:hypothetical protein
LLGKRDVKGMFQLVFETSLRGELTEN